MKTTSAIISHRNSRVRCHGGVLGLFLVLALLAIAVVVIVWRTQAKAPPLAQHTRTDLQHQIGIEVAKVTRNVSAPIWGPVVVFTLVAQKSGPYADQLAALASALEEAEIETEICTPRSIGLRQDMPYTDAYALILKQFTPSILVALVHGGIDIGPIPQALEEYMDGKGRLVLLGDLSEANSPFIRWVRHGKAIIVARHSGVLQHRAPDARHLDPSITPQQYFQRYYSVLTSENVDRMLAGCAENAVAR